MKRMFTQKQIENIASGIVNEALNDFYDKDEVNGLLANKQYKITHNNVVNNAVEIDDTIITGEQQDDAITTAIQSELDKMKNAYAIKYQGSYLILSGVWQPSENVYVMSFASVFYGSAGVAGLASLYINVSVENKITSEYYEI